jgi:3-methyladenine DNA glycosylase/8-oxoguanine DNA glycosylase
VGARQFVRSFEENARGERNGPHLNVEGQYVVQHSVKTICTTNTAWSGTRKMTAALVDNLGVRAPGGARTFPTATAMAELDESFYRDVVRAGYRGPYLKTLASAVAEERPELEQLNDPDLPDEEVAQRLSRFRASARTPPRT